MTNTDTPVQGIGLSEAASQIASFLDGPADNQTSEQDAADESPASDDQAEALEASATEDETPADEAGAEDEEAAANDEDAEEASDPMEQLVTVKIDGKEEQIPLKEAIAGYQRQADYSRKTGAIAEQRKQLEQEAQQVMAERAQYAQLLSVLQQQLTEAAPQEPNWEKLYAEDPLEYVRQKDIWRDREQKLQAATVEQQRVMALIADQQSKQLQQMVQQGREKLTELVPAWKDKTRWETDRTRLRSYATEKLGYSDEEISQAYDPRAVLALYKAMRYDEIMAKRPAPQVQKSPAPMRAGSPQTAPARRHSEITRQKQRLAQTGRVGDAAKLFESLI